MTQIQLRPARGNGTGLGIGKLASFNPENIRPLPEVQSDFLAARFGLDATRARVVAELAFGEERP